MVPPLDRDAKPTDVPSWWVGLLVLVVVGYRLFGVGEWVLRYFWHYLIAGLSTIDLFIFGTVALAIGWTAYSVRERAPRAYGGIEIGFGIATCLHYLSRVSSEKPATGMTPLVTTTLLGVVAGIYLVVRGIDNATKRRPALQSEPSVVRAA